ncbi:MAG: DUF2336 domain-containing protein [Micavibrio sp.]
MLKFLKSLFKRRDPAFVMKQIRDPSRYEHEKAVARSPDSAQRMLLAKNPKTHQEILYYMAENEPDSDIRKAIADNLATPIQASGFMTRDTHADVRLGLAERLVRLLPELSQEDHSQLYAIAVQALGTLAMDEVLKIRKAMASALKDHAYAPPSVVAQLAKDVEREVAEPILRFCTVLPDDVLLDILKGAPDSWAVQAIAGRKKVSEPVSVAVIETGDAKGGQVLLKNAGAVIGPDLLREIVRRARELPEWQEPLALRKGLPPDISHALAGFAQESVRQILIRRSDFDRHTIEKISSVMKRRLAYATASAHAQEAGNEAPYDRAVRLAREGLLSEQMISDALGMKEIDFVIAALGCLAQTSLPNIKRIIALKAAKPIVALSWKAGLSMRMALQLQQELGRVPPRELIYPRDGTDYPLSPEEMNRQLEFLGLKAA